MNYVMSDTTRNEIINFLRQVHPYVSSIKDNDTLLLFWERTKEEMLMYQGNSNVMYAGKSVLFWIEHMKKIEELIVEDMLLKVDREKL